MTRAGRKYYAGGERVISPVENTDEPFCNDNQREYETFRVGTLWEEICASNVFVALQSRVINEMARVKINSESLNKYPARSFRSGVIVGLIIHNFEGRSFNLENVVDYFGDLAIRMRESEFTDLLDKNRQASLEDTRDLLEFEYSFLDIPEDHIDLFEYGILVAEATIRTCTAVESTHDPEATNWSTN